METYPGYLKGYRILYFHPYKYEYFSPYRIWKWDGSSSPALCFKKKKHDIPSLKCTCGYYAYFKYEDLLKKEVLASPHIQTTVCLAAVRAYGKIVLHELGFRSQYMELCTIVPLRKLMPNMLDAMEEAANKIGANFSVRHGVLKC